jgi:hypothetical protein
MRTHRGASREIDGLRENPDRTPHFQDRSKRCGRLPGLRSAASGIDR